MAKQEGGISTDKKDLVNESYITKLISTKHIRAEETLQFLRPIVARDGHISVFGPGNLLMVVDSALNIEKIMSILKQIDKPIVREEEAVINVYFLEHADATELSQVLQGVIKDLKASHRKVPAGKSRTASSAASFLNVTPDKTTNSLIIIAPPSDYRKIVDVVKRLDRKRKQVFVEAMIIEASIDKLKELGTRWRLAATHKGEPVAVGGFGNINTSSLQAIMTGITGFSVGGMGNFMSVPVSTVSSSGTISTENLTAPGFAALFSMNYFEDAINILSTPQILTSDNEEAEIVVGENVPFISQRERDITTTNTVLNSIERKNVGITLRLTPQITEGDYVKLDIFQEISAVKTTTESILTTVGPTTTTRSTKTSVVVKDGDTVVIGGLMQEQEKTGVAKTPILGDLPLIGWLFKFKTVEKDKKNLLIFLSPHVVKESTELLELTEKKQEKFSITEPSETEKLLVKFKDGISKETAAEIILENDARIIKYFENINVYHIKLKPGQEVGDAVKNFTSLPEVIYAEPEHKLKIQNKFPPPAPDEDRKQPAPPGSRMDIEEETAPEKETALVDEAIPEEESVIEEQMAMDEEPVIEDEISSSVEETVPEEAAVKEEILTEEGTVSKEIVMVPVEEAILQEKTAPEEETVSESETASVVETVIEEQTPAEEETVREVAAETIDQTIHGTTSVSRQDDNKEQTPIAITEHPAILIINNSPKARPAGKTGNRHVKPAEEEKTDSTEDSAYYIQAGSWTHIEYARETIGKLKPDYPDVYMLKQGSYNKVRIPIEEDDKNDALILMKDIEEKFDLTPILVKRSK
jgi:type II secretory pathway component GspD/PulD (secretin)